VKQNKEFERDSGGTRGRVREERDIERCREEARSSKIKRCRNHEREIESCVMREKDQEMEEGSRDCRKREERDRETR
jgi:hypothetical protein